MQRKHYEKYDTKSYFIIILNFTGGTPVVCLSLISVSPINKLQRVNEQPLCSTHNK